MKQILFGFLILILSSCTKTSLQRSELNANDQKLIRDYSVVGKIHNTGLDVIYNRVKDLVNAQTKQQIQNSFEVGDKITLKEMNAFVFGYLKDSLSIVGIDNFEAYYSKDTVIKNLGFSDEPLATHFSKVMGYDLNPTLIAALNDFELVFKDDSKNTIESYYDALLNNWIPLLQNDIDKIAYISALSVGRNSLLYWQANQAKWDDLEMELTGTVSAKVGKDVAYADCAGAITGTIAGAYAGATGGTVVIPVVGTAVGGACGVLVGCIGGAITSSAAAGVHAAIQWLINW